MTRSSHWPPSPRSVLKWFAGVAGAVLVAFLTWIAGGHMDSQIVQGQQQQQLETLVEVSKNNTAGIGSLKVKDAKQDAELSRVGAINAKLDVLLMQRIEEASPRRKESMKRHARKVRSAARKRGETDDPLAGLEGL